MTAGPADDLSNDIAHVRDAQRRLLLVIDGLDDATVRRASLLPGWTVGHVLAHVARNADSHVRRCEAAARGETVEQYPGGYAGRAAEIEATAFCSAAELVDDVRSSAQHLDDTWTALPKGAWDVITIDVGGRERPLAALPARRWQELEVHAVDLGVSVTFRDWPDDFVHTWLPRVRRSLPYRLADGAHAPSLGTLDGRDELAWLYGRLEREDLPELAPWG